MTVPLRVLGVDPGKTCGYVLLSVRPLKVMEWAQIPVERAPAEFQRLTELASLVAVERYTVRPAMAGNALTPQYDAMYVVGGLLFLARLGNVPMRIQTPADAKNVFSDHVLRELGYYETVSGPHARDALRHGLLAARTVYSAI